MAEPPGPDHASHTVAGVRIDLQDAAEEVNYPTLRTRWPDVAHSPSVLTFTNAGFTFKSLRSQVSDDDRHQFNLRSEFTGLAIAMTSLGKGPHIKKRDGTTEEDKGRSVAYLDAIMMGERAGLRHQYLGKSSSYSSCGMFVRNLYKLIGVKIPSYSDVYKGGVMAEEENFARTHDALVRPGEKFEPVLDANGNPVTENGKPVVRPVMPKLGDAIYYESTTHRHVQVVIGVAGLQGQVVRRPGKDGKIRQYQNAYYHVAQGGVGATSRFPDDGPCMGINQAFVLINTEKWTANIGGNVLPVNYGWIDIYKLALHCDDEPMIKPVRQNIW